MSQSDKKLAQLRKDNYELKRENNELGKSFKEIRAENDNYYRFIADDKARYITMQNRIGDLMQEVKLLKEELKEKEEYIKNVKNKILYIFKSK